MERTPNKSQHTKLTLEKKILPPFLPGFELATCLSRDRLSNQQDIPTQENTTLSKSLLFPGWSRLEYIVMCVLRLLPGILILP